MSRTAAPVDRRARTTHGCGFWIAAAAGISVAGYGIVGYLAKYPDLTRRLALARWIVGIDLVHDLLVAPLVVVVGAVVRKLVPPRALGPTQFALMASAIVLLIAWRPLHRSGAYKHNPTVQPLDYATATLTVMAVIWTIAAAWFLLRVVRRPNATPAGNADL